MFIANGRLFIAKAKLLLSSKMADVKRTSNKKRSLARKKERKLSVNVEPIMEISLPSEEWFQEMWTDGDGDDDDYDPIPQKSALKVDASSSKKRRHNARKRAKLSTEDCEVIDISDGEELYQAFPVPEPKEVEHEEEEDDDLDGEDFVVLYESVKVKKTLKQEILEKTNNLLEGTSSSIAIKKVKEAEKEPPTQEKTIKALIPKQLQNGKTNWFLVYGVNPINHFNFMTRIGKYRDKYHKDFKAFDKSIWDHMTENLQNDHTFTWKMRVKNLLADVVKKALSGGELVAVGSTVNGCGAFNSDMDLCLCLPCPMNGYQTPRGYAVRHLKKVQKWLMFEESIRMVKYIPAKVPILNIHFKAPYQTLEVDMNVNNTPGIFNSFLLHYYSRIDDRFPALCLLIKHWAKRRGILDACRGFFNSYSIILMTVHFLQCVPQPPILPNLQALYPEHFCAEKELDHMQLFVPLPHPLPEVPKNKSTVGELLIAFFDYFNSFNFEKEAISIRRGRTFRRTELAANTRRFKVFVEEPFDMQNTARCVTNDEQWSNILDAFSRAVWTFSEPRKPDLKSFLMSA